jgi:hypothetical protein
VAAEKTVDQPAAAPAEPAAAAAAAAVSAAAAEAAVPAAVEAVVPAAAAGKLEQKGINSASGGCTESLKIS